MNQLLSGDVPDGFKCDVRSLGVLANVPRATLYRTYPHLKAEFDQHLGRLREAGTEPDPHVAQVERLKGEVVALRDRISRTNAATAELEAFRHMALSRLAAQHEEITALRRDLDAARSVELRFVPRTPVRPTGADWAAVRKPVLDAHTR